MKEKYIENNIEYILAEDGIYYSNLQLPFTNKDAGFVHYYKISNSIDIII